MSALKASNLPSKKTSGRKIGYLAKYLGDLTLTDFEKLINGETITTSPVPEDFACICGDNLSADFEPIIEEDDNLCQDGPSEEMTGKSLVVSCTGKVDLNNEAQLLAWCEANTCDISNDQKIFLVYDGLFTGSVIDDPMKAASVKLFATAAPTFKTPKTVSIVTFEFSAKSGKFYCLEGSESWLPGCFPPPPVVTPSAPNVQNI